MNERQERARRKNGMCLHHNTPMQQSPYADVMVCSLGCVRNNTSNAMILGRLRDMWWIKPCKRVWSMN